MLDIGDSVGRTCGINLGVAAKLRSPRLWTCPPHSAFKDRGFYSEGAYQCVVCIPFTSTKVHPLVLYTRPANDDDPTSG